MYEISEMQLRIFGDYENVSVSVIYTSEQQNNLKLIGVIRAAILE